MKRVPIAPIQRRCCGRTAERGFTLVELMVVIVVIALASAAAVWALPGADGRVRDEAARFAARARVAHDAAITAARPVSVWVTSGGYGFDRREAGGWVPLGDRPLRLERWGAGTRAALGDTARARVVFDQTGLADRPLDVRVVRGRAAALVRIGADGSVTLGA